MNINDIIAVAKYERTMKEISENNVSEILKGIQGETLTEAEVLNVKYNKLAEELRETDYSSRINWLMKDKKITPEKASKLHEDITAAKKLTESTNVDDIRNAYRKLSDFKSILESDDERVVKNITILESKHRAYKEYQPGEKFHHQTTSVQNKAMSIVNAQEKRNGKDFSPKDRAKAIHNALKKIGEKQAKINAAIEKAKIEAEKKKIAKNANANNAISEPNIYKDYIKRTEDYNSKHPEINKNKKD